jgi:hypothetical protein
MQAIRDMMVFLSAVLLAHPLTVSTALHMGYLIGVGKRYHSTVLRMPLSKVSTGFQPNSFSSFRASIA